MVWWGVAAAGAAMEIVGFGLMWWAIKTAQEYPWDERM
jgi:hypothetical protein